MKTAPGVSSEHILRGLEKSSAKKQVREVETHFQGSTHLASRTWHFNYATDVGASGCSEDRNAGEEEGDKYQRLHRCDDVVQS
jgi:hypothetical protein